MKPKADPESDKLAIRRKVRAAVSAMTPQQKAAESVTICERIQKLDLYQKAHVVMMFVPLPDEPLIAPLAQHALARGKTLLIPRVNWHDNTMIAGLVQSWPGDITKDHKGMAAPLDDAPTYDPGSIHLILVPGVAFSMTGVRLGRGGGFYDRYLTQIPIQRRIGLCFRCQRVDTIPLLPHDEPVSKVITA